MFWMFSEVLAFFLRGSALVSSMAGLFLGAARAVPLAGGGEVAKPRSTRAASVSREARRDIASLQTHRNSKERAGWRGSVKRRSSRGARGCGRRELRRCVSLT